MIRNVFLGNPVVVVRFRGSPKLRKIRHLVVILLAPAATGERSKARSGVTSGVHAEVPKQSHKTILDIFGRYVECLLYFLTQLRSIWSV